MSLGRSKNPSSYFKINGNNYNTQNQSKNRNVM